MRFAWLGTGLMGRPMAARLCAAGHTVWVWNRTAAKAAPLQASGAHLAATAGEAVAASEGVFLMLQDAAAIDATLLAGDTSAQGRTVIQMGTIGPEESRALGDRLVAVGCDYLEAPVLGSIPQAEAGTLQVMAGSTPAQFARWRPILQCFGPEPVHVGPVGQAASLKLALNQLIAALTCSFSFSLGLVRRSGIDVDLFMRILRQSALFAPTFDKKLARMLARDFEAPSFPTRHLQKDLRLALAAGRRLGLETAAAAAVLPLLERAIELGHADADYSSLYAGIDPAGTSQRTG